MADIELVLPYPPSVNHYWGERAIQTKLTKKSKGRKRLIVIKYLTKRARDFRKQVNFAVSDQLDVAPRLRGRLAVIVYEYDGGMDEQHEAFAKRQDIDNCIKPLFDALEAAKVYINDSQIDEMLVVKKRRAAIGRVEVIVKTLGE